MLEKDTRSYRPPARPTYSLRLSTRERQVFEVAAMNREVTLAEYLRMAATEAARRDLGAVR